MVYRFTIISDEVDNFRREIQIDSEATFLDFHRAILKSAGYPDDQMTSFFICDEDWEKEFAQIVREHKTTIYTVCYMFSKDKEEVEDLFQDILMMI